jgi:hypothetical protein
LSLHKLTALYLALLGCGRMVGYSELGLTAEDSTSQSTVAHHSTLISAYDSTNLQ